MGCVRVVCIAAAAPDHAQDSRSSVLEFGRALILERLAVDAGAASSSARRIATLHLRTREQKSKRRRANSQSATSAKSAAWQLADASCAVEPLWMQMSHRPLLPLSLCAFVHHEIFNHSMESNAIIIAFFGQLTEIIARLGCVLPVAEAQTRSRVAQSRV